MRGDARTAALPPMERGRDGDGETAITLIGLTPTACSHGNGKFCALFSEGVWGTAAGALKAPTTVPPNRIQRRGDSPALSSVGVDGGSVSLDGSVRARWRKGRPGRATTTPWWRRARAMPSRTSGRAGACARRLRGDRVEWSRRRSAGRCARRDDEHQIAPGRGDEEVWRNLRPPCGPRSPPAAAARSAPGAGRARPGALRSMRAIRDLPYASPLVSAAR